MECKVKYCIDCPMLGGDDYPFCAHPEGPGYDIYDINFEEDIHSDCPLLKASTTIILERDE